MTIYLFPNRHSESLVCDYERPGWTGNEDRGWRPLWRSSSMFYIGRGSRSKYPYTGHVRVSKGTSLRVPNQITR